VHRRVTGRRSGTYGTDTQISNFQAFDAVDVQTLIEHTVLDNRVTLPRSH
jgi:hypothetical protein